MAHLLGGRNVFAVLPTSFGKSVCFGGFPRASDTMHPGAQCIVVIVAPLNALTADKQQSWEARGVRAVVLKGRSSMDEHIVSDIANGKVPLLFTSPEVVQQEPWWGILRKLRKQIRLLVVDEAHCLYKWGSTFRPDYLKAGDLRGILGNAVTLALTATATQKLVTEVSTSLGLEGEIETVFLLPDRPEIYLHIARVGKDPSHSLSWYINMLETRQRDTPKAIIYVRTIVGVSQVFTLLYKVLGARARQDGNVDDVSHRFVEMFHGLTDPDSKE